MENNALQEYDLEPIIATLAHPDSYRTVYHRLKHDVPMPSIEALESAIELLRRILFPGYFGNSELTPHNIRFYIGAAMSDVLTLLTEQIKRGICFSSTGGVADSCDTCEYRARDLTRRFLERLPEVRRLLASDAKAAYEGDPAAKSISETIFCYPSITALLHHRLAHELYLLGVPFIPRIISERAHSLTGIDIHPGARIGESFFIDHGTGVVIGETTVIGRGVRIYQGVTLGAKSFQTDDEGHLVKGIPRHPIVEDDVTIYAGATLLGRITIGRGAVIGGNVWLTCDVAAGCRVLQRAPGEVVQLAAKEEI